MILREAKWLDRICVHDYSFLGVPVDSIEVVETGTAYIRFCKKCGLEVEIVLTVLQDLLKFIVIVVLALILSNQ